MCNDLWDLWQMLTSAQGWHEALKIYYIRAQEMMFEHVTYWCTLPKVSCNQWQIAKSVLLNRECDTWLCTFSRAYIMFSCPLYQCFGLSMRWSKCYYVKNLFVNEDQMDLIIYFPHLSPDERLASHLDPGGESRLLGHTSWRWMRIQLMASRQWLRSCFPTEFFLFINACHNYKSWTVK